MCNNCYHSRGRAKRAWNCSHSDKFHYAFGLCQNCYQIKYCKKRKTTEKIKNNVIDSCKISDLDPDNKNSS